MRIISFSLFGENPRYCVGAIRNAELAKTIYEGWTCRFYIDATVPIDYVMELYRLNCEIIHVPPQPSHLYGMCWRFLVADSDCDYWIVRDADSRLSLREKSAVDEWIESGKKFHIMRDHPQHYARIMGGMFGGKRRAVAMSDELSKWNDFGYYGWDQAFLDKIIYPKIKDDAILHVTHPYYSDEHVNSFPTPYSEWRFVGERYEHDESRNTDDLQQLLLHPKSRSY